MALQFASVIEISSKGRKRKSGEKGAAAALESVTRREQSLVLFHLMGKVLYNKRILFFCLILYVLINVGSRQR
jgi:cell cycle checkpoint protein